MKKIKFGFLNLGCKSRFKQMITHSRNFVCYHYKHFQINLKSTSVTLCILYSTCYFLKYKMAVSHSALETGLHCLTLVETGIILSERRSNAQFQLRFRVLARKSKLYFAHCKTMVKTYGIKKSFSKDFKVQQWKKHVLF